jgi:hypothetical protein
MTEAPIKSESTATTGVILGKFVKVLVAGTRKAGQYRGQGNLQVTSAGLKITGRHVYTMGQRWLFGIGLVIGTYVVTAGILRLGWLLVYLVVEYAWLKKGHQTIPFDRIEAFKSVAKKKLIAIQFIGTEWESPLVLKSDQWRLLDAALASRIPRARLA